jgi:hypothetical protein
MHIIRQYFTEYKDPSTGEIQTNVWLISAKCSTLVDALAQLQRFIDTGILPENLQLTIEE